jgi:hypothetical protein
MPDALTESIIKALRDANIPATEETGRCLKNLGTRILEKAFDQRVANLPSVKYAQARLGSLPLPTH